MDPNACLTRFYQALAAEDLEEARDAHLDLREWLSSGGFEPDWAVWATNKEGFRDWSAE